MLCLLSRSDSMRSCDLLLSLYPSSSTLFSSVISGPCVAMTAMTAMPACTRRGFEPEACQRRAVWSEVGSSLLNFILHNQFVVCISGSIPMSARATSTPGLLVLKNRSRVQVNCVNSGQSSMLCSDQAIALQRGPPVRHGKIGQ